MSSRVISIKEMAGIGLKLNFIGVAVLSLVAYFVWGWMIT
jgi:di/tricarboxylate transporter